MPILVQTTEGPTPTPGKIDVSIIFPFHNSAPWIRAALDSVTAQSFTGNLQISAYNDGSTDDSEFFFNEWVGSLATADRNIDVILNTNSDQPKGVGFAKNRAMEAATGQYLCFFDSDDIMDADRVKAQYDAAQGNEDAIIGCQIRRLPADSTPRYSRWANSLTPEQLYTQAYTSFGPTLLMPTWFCHRDVITRTGFFSQMGLGSPEDLHFFFAHLERGGKLIRVDKVLLTYRYHSAAASLSVLEAVIWNARLEAFQARVLDQWENFSIWNAGKQGRRFYRSLWDCNRDKVRAFCDVDDKKIAKGVYTFEESDEVPRPTVPIISFKNVSPPFVICVKQNSTPEKSGNNQAIVFSCCSSKLTDLTGGQLEENLASLNLTEGVDYFWFN